MDTPCAHNRLLEPDMTSRPRPTKEQGEILGPKMQAALGVSRLTDCGLMDLQGMGPKPVLLHFFRPQILRAYSLCFRLSRFACTAVLFPEETAR